MKNRKLWFAFLTCYLLLLFVACNDNSFGGRYVISAIQDEPNGMNLSELEIMYKEKNLVLQDYCYMEFHENGHYKIMLFGNEEAKGKYTLINDTLTLQYKNSNSTAKVSGQSITWTFSDFSILTFKKE